jgi:hypothetical protein
MQIKFFVAKAEPANAPCFVLKRSLWDDYGFKTSFELRYVASSDSKPNIIGAVKIGYFGQPEGTTRLPNSFEELSSDYFSLGQSEEYYSRLSELGADIEGKVLERLRDLRLNQNIMNSADKEIVVIRSLARFLGPANLMNKPLGKSITSNDEREYAKNKRLALDFSCTLRGSSMPTLAQFAFDADSVIPGRLNLIIGKNGVGKTQFLANLVGAITGLADTGIISDSRQDFSKVFAVSYSIFDRFFMPSDVSIPGTTTKTLHLEEHAKYEYIGIREKSKKDKYPRIIGPNTLSRHFVEAIRRIRDTGNMQDWLDIMCPVLQDAGVSGNDLASDDQKLRNRFSKLGAGHKVSLSILTQLYSKIEKDSLVVVDEPENHMHPSLLSATIHVLQDIIAAKHSFAILSSHSPIVAQETPSKYINVVSRVDNQTTFTKVLSETLGTSIDTIISYLFGIHSDLPGYRSLLKRLALEKRISLDKLNEILERELSFEAASYLISIGDLGK